MVQKGYAQDISLRDMCIHYKTEPFEDGIFKGSVFVFASESGGLLILTPPPGGGIRIGQAFKKQNACKA